MFGSPYNSDPNDCVRIIHTALDAGINFVNSADWYREGQSEEATGKALLGRRDEVVISTKVNIHGDGRPNSGGAKRHRLIEAVDASLKRLQTDRIDFYILAHVDVHTDVEESLSVLTDLVRQGKIVSFGCSKFPPEQIVEAHWMAERRHLMKFRIEEAQYSMFDRHIEAGVAPVCERYGMGLIAFSPLAGSWLTGRYRQPTDIDLSQGRAVQNPRRFDPGLPATLHKLELVRRLDEIAQDAGIPLVHMAIAFVAAHPSVSSAIIGPRTMEQLKDLLAGVEVALDDETLDRIDAVVPPGEIIEGPAHLYGAPALDNPSLRRRILGDRPAG